MRFAGTSINMCLVCSRNLVNLLLQKRRELHLFSITTDLNIVLLVHAGDPTDLQGEVIALWNATLKFLNLLIAPFHAGVETVKDRAVDSLH